MRLLRFLWVERHPAVVPTVREPVVVAPQASPVAGGASTAECERERLKELDPALGDLSLYRTRQLVPSQRVEELRRCDVMIANWHRLAKRESSSVNGDTARVVKTGEAMEVVRQQWLAPFRFSIPPASRIAYATVFRKDLSDKAEIQATWAGHFPITQPAVIEKMFMASIQQLNGETQAAGET